MGTVCLDYRGGDLALIFPPIRSRVGRLQQLDVSSGHSFPKPQNVSDSFNTMNRNNFIVGQVTPDMLSKITYGTYILFGALTFMGAGFVWFFVPETKRLTLEEMVRLCFL